MNKFIKSLITFLILVLFCALTLLAFTYFNSVKAGNTAQTTQVTVNKQVSDYKTTEQIISNKVHNENEMIVLTGNQVIKKTFSSTDHEVTYQGGDSAIKFLSNSLNSWNTKNIQIQTEYQYDFKYNMKNVLITQDSNHIYQITLNEIDLNLNPLSEISGNRVITSDHGALSSGFTPTEVSAVMYSTSIHTYNTLVNDKGLYDRAVLSVQDNLTTLCEGLGIPKDNIKFNIIYSTFLANNEVEKVN